MVKHLHKDQVQVKVTVDKPVYLLGDTLNGTIDLNIKTDNIPGQLYMKFMGIEKTNQLDLISNFFTMKRRFYTKKIRVSDLGRQEIHSNKKKKNNSPMPIIETQKRFNFIIPEDRPPSFCINYWKDVQCRIFYVIAIYFTNEAKNVIYKPSKSHKICIFIIKRANPIPQPIKASNYSHVVKKCCFSAGKSLMSVILNKQEFEIDDLAETIVNVDNTKSNLSITQLRMSVQARLEVRYKSNKASNRSYFPFCNKVFKESIDAGQKKQVTLQMILQPSEEKYKIYPQSTIESKDIQYYYTLCVEAFFQFAFNPNTQKSYQLQKRNQVSNSYQQQSRVHSFSSPNQQFLQADDQLEQIKIEYGDKDIEGYGPQDGYFGPPRKGSFEHSMESVELRGQVIYSNKTETEPLEHSYSVDGKGTRNWKKPKAQMKQGIQKQAVSAQKNKGMQKQMVKNFSARKLFGKK